MILREVEVAELIPVVVLGCVVAGEVVVHGLFGEVGLGLAHGLVGVHRVVEVVLVCEFEIDFKFSFISQL